MDIQSGFSIPAPNHRPRPDTDREQEALKAGKEF
jgi:hypothetical protein